jgi:hypothetical protein
MATDKTISQLPIATTISASDVSVLVDGGSDYQYTFTLLLQFLEANLTTGANISFGATLPQNTDGNNGDVFVNTSAGSFAQKVSGAWVVVYTVPAANAADGTLLYGAGMPASATGKNADSYINTLTGIFYQKSSGAWAQVFSMATGPQGPQGIAGANGTNGINGNTILFGSANPSNTAIGADGNFYINTSSYMLFGPKVSGVWGNGISIIGVGIPVGGTTGQILAKADGVDFNTSWEDNSFAGLSGEPADNANLAAALTMVQSNITAETTRAEAAEAARVDKVTGYGLSSNDYTSAEKTKLANLSEHFVGVFSSAAALSAAHPTGADGQYATVETTGVPGVTYIWDTANIEWVAGGTGSVTSVNSQTGAVSLSTDAIGEGSANLYFTAARVLATILNGLSFGTISAVTATDTILSAIGKLQAQLTSISGKMLPAGGATGQVLAKASTTDWDAGWITVTTGGAGYTLRIFDEILTFDVPFKMVTTQTADIAFLLGSSPVADVDARVTVTGDGTHACTFPADWVNANGQVFDNTFKNIIYLEYDGIEVLYSIVKVATPDITPPLLVSAVISNLAKNQIVLTYSELLASGTIPATGDFACNLSKAVTAVSISGSEVTVTVNANYSYGDAPTISYIPGGNKIQDPSGNDAAALVAQAVTNNVLPASTSLSITASNQICKSMAEPLNLAFGSGGADTPMSCSFWVKRANTASATLVSFGTSIANFGFTAQVDNTGILYFQLFSGGGQAYIILNTGISASVWTHLCLTYDGTKLASGMKIYINGTLAATTVGLASYAGQVAFTSSVVLAVMGGPDNSQPADNVLLDSLYFWNVDLTTGNITAIYNGGALVDPTTLGITSNLQARYEFDSSLVDAGPNGYNLSSTVAPTYSTDVV